MRNRVSEALPKTYHQPIGPAAPAGMGCVSIGRMLSRTRSRASNQSPTAFSQRFMIGPPGRSVSCKRGVVRRLDFQPAVCVIRQSHWNRPRGGGPEARSPLA